MLGDRFKKISFIIPVRPGSVPSNAIKHIYALNYPDDLFEIIVAEGFNPSLQRNRAVAQAKGEIIYFLDDDSLVSPDSIDLALKYFKEENIAAVGGPALSAVKNIFLEDLFTQILGSFFGSFTTWTRFRAVGKTRKVSGERLILCNLMMSKDVFQELNGLNVSLYPNEENELFKRMRKAGYKFYYIPEMSIQKPMRSSIAAFIKQMFSYGSGRGTHFLNNFSFQDLIFFLPSLFIFYLFCLLIFSSPLLLIPLLLYLLFIGVGAVEVGFRSKSILSAVTAFPLFALMHLTYGVGLLCGLLKISRQVSDINSFVKLTRFSYSNSL